MIRPSLWLLLLTALTGGSAQAQSPAPAARGLDELYVKGDTLQQTLLRTRARLQAWQTHQNEARRAIQFAREEAKRLGQPAVGTEHILLGVLHCEDSPAMQALKAEGVTLEAARGCLQPTMPGIPPGGSQPAEDYAVSPQARHIIEGARREAMRRGDLHIGAEHMLLALLADSRNGAVQTLEQLRTNPARVERQLERERAAAAPPALDPPSAGQLTSRKRPLSTS